jgi:hypothetical protein
MLKETITYQDFNGVTRTEDFYFNLTEAETMEMEMSANGGFSEYIRRIIAAQDTATLIKIFKDLILKAYGERSLDGRQFIKKPELAEAFSYTEAYSQLFMKLATNTEAATKFVNGIAPKKKAEEATSNSAGIVTMPTVN